MKRYFLLLISFFLHLSSLRGEEYVVGELLGQMGNNLFQIATTQALAWDHSTEAYFPGLIHNPKLYNHVFSRCKVVPPNPEISGEWHEPSFAYHPIPYASKMRLHGYYQSEKYFAHHRERLLKLFAPIARDHNYMKKKYGWLLENPNTVGIQLRFYKEDTNGEYYPQYGKDYVEKAMSYFPAGSLFVVSSNDLEYARKNVPSHHGTVIFLEGEEAYIDFYLLSFCKHNIITNSSFGWWSAWLNQNPNKIVIRPKVWMHSLPCGDVCPESWIALDAKGGRSGDPNSY